MEIQVRLMSGDLHTLRCEEIISIDGRDYAATNSESQEERMTVLEGRVLAIESILSQAISPTGE